MLIAAVGAWLAASHTARADLRGLSAPGPLAAPHGHLDDKCDACHVPFAGVPNDKCLDCHTDLAERIRKKDGAHAAGAPFGDRKCTTCHKDHKGREHALTLPVDGKSFLHALTGFVLDGRHAGVACAACHPHEPSATGGRTKWVGIATTCVGCHGDTHHHGGLGTECTRCHTTATWKATTRTLADHKLPMTGGHTDLPCVACHKKGTHFVATSSCADCHEQKHGGTSSPCARCHATTDWKAATFQHDFCTCILPGKHQTAPCLSCHPGFRFTPTPFDCAGCHAKERKHDDVGPCARCHSALTWKNTRKFDHDKQVPRFPLDGKHLQVGCENCHRTVRGVTQFKGAPVACEGCHKVPAHGDFGTCAKCHATSGFRPSRFSHDTTRFPLAGPHQALGCPQCHASLVKPGRFVPGPNSCAQCHGDPHRGQFDGGSRQGALLQDSSPWVQRSISPVLQRSDLRARLAPTGDAPGSAIPRGMNGAAQQGAPRRHLTACLDCHTPDRWTPTRVTPAVHASFAYALDGVHATLQCSKCHKPDPASPSHATKFVGLATRCAGCHFDAHGGRLGSACDKCHEPTTWRDVERKFDHRAISGGVALTGGHRIACAECHGGEGRPDKVAAAEEEAERRHEKLSCAGCHEAAHGEQFGRACATCHQPTTFRDVPRFDHAKTDFPLERRHAALPCLACHEARSGTSQRRIDRNCITCHADPHYGQTGSQCGDCHRPDRWTLVRFDHDRTEFPLRGRHFIVRCTECHKNQQWIGTRSECVTCHALDRQNDASHPPADFNCAGCHTPFGWKLFKK